MPCQSDYMEPNARERESRKVAELLCYVYPLLALNVPPEILKIARDTYGDTSEVDRLTEHLCTLCKTMSEENADRIIYNARNSDARALANWWENHQRADALRENEERKREKRAKIANAALAKLTKTEREALGL